MLCGVLTELCCLLKLLVCQQLLQVVLSLLSDHSHKLGSNPIQFSSTVAAMQIHYTLHPAVESGGNHRGLLKIKEQVGGMLDRIRPSVSHIS